MEFEWFQLSLCYFDMSNEIQEIASFFKDTCDSKNIRLILPLEQCIDKLKLRLTVQR